MEYPLTSPRCEARPGSPDRSFAAPSRREENVVSASTTVPVPEAHRRPRVTQGVRWEAAQHDLTASNIVGATLIQSSANGPAPASTWHVLGISAAISAAACNKQRIARHPEGAIIGRLSQSTSIARPRCGAVGSGTSRFAGRCTRIPATVEHDYIDGSRRKSTLDNSQDLPTLQRVGW